MQLRRDTEYALRIMVYIAECIKKNGKHSGVPSSHLIISTGVPAISFNRICGCLKGKGMIRKETGEDGEKWLYPGNNFWQQSILSIAEAVEGNMNIFLIFDKKSFLSQVYGKKLRETQDNVLRALEETTLESILEDC